MGVSIILALFFIVVLGLIGFAVYAIAMWLRDRQLDPERDLAEHPVPEPQQTQRPEHVRVSSDQRTDFV